MHNSMKQPKGFSLIEAMVALFVLAVGLFGALALQIQSMKHNKDSYAYVQAIYIANDIAERMRANARANYATTSPLTALTQTDVYVNCKTDCDSTAQKNRDLYHIKGALKNIPNGSVSISKDGDNYSINVNFSVSPLQQTMANNLSTRPLTNTTEQAYTLKVRI